MTVFISFYADQYFISSLLQGSQTSFWRLFPNFYGCHSQTCQGWCCLGQPKKLYAQLMLQPITINCIVEHQIIVIYLQLVQLMYHFNYPSILKIKAHFTKLQICSSLGKLWLMCIKCTGNKFILSHRRCSIHNCSTAHFCVQLIALQIFKHD